MSDRSDILKGAADLLAQLDLQDSPELAEIAGKAATRARRGALPYRYMRIEPFNPDSTLQIQALAKHYGIKLPRRKDSDDEDALSTEKKYLKQAAKKYPVFQLIIDCKERWKMLSTYNWRLDERGRVTGIIGHHPSTWRKSMRDYNLQNIPKRSDLAEEFRRMIVAPPGYAILEADSSAIEAVLVGYFAKSQRIINLAKAGIHDWFNAVVHNEPFSPDLPFDELRSLCKAAKRRYDKESREVAKRVVHLTNYKGTPERIHDEYPDNFATVRIARQLQNLYISTEVGQDLQRWWRQTWALAGPPNRFLMNPFGFRHRFFSVFTYNRRTGMMEPNGDDAKRAIAFLPQSSASALQDIYISTLTQTALEPYLRLPIHDSTMAVVPEEFINEGGRLMTAAFTQPIPELGGLSIGAEVKVSAVSREGALGNWGGYDERENPLGMREWKEAA